MQAFGGFLILLGLLMAVLGALAAAVPKVYAKGDADKVKPIRTGGLVMLLALAPVSCIAGGAVLPHPATPAPSSASRPVKDAATESGTPALKSLKTADPKIRSVERVGEQLQVTAFIDTAWNDQQYVDFAADIVQQVGGALQKGALEDQPHSSTVLFKVSAAGTDRLGNETPIGLVDLTYSADDLRKAKFENLTWDRVLNIAEEVKPSSPGGLKSLLLWCGEEAHRSEAPIFCSKVLD